MGRLAGYQVFCWLAIAFVTLGGTSSRATVVVLGLGLGLTAAAGLIRRASQRRVMAGGRRP